MIWIDEVLLWWKTENYVVDMLLLINGRCVVVFMFKSGMNMLKFDRRQFMLIDSCKFGDQKGCISLVKTKRTTGIFLFQIRFRCLQESCIYEC